MTGYYTMQVTFTYQEQKYTREAELYVSEGAQLREYWTTIAVPNNVDAGAFAGQRGGLT